MLETRDHTAKAVLRQVFGWVLVLPLLVSFLRLPFPFGVLMAVGAIAASAYGVMLAFRHASKRVAVCALMVTLLNVISLILLGTASVLNGLYIIAWLHWYPYYSSWMYWNF